MSGNVSWRIKANDSATGRSVVRDKGLMKKAVDNSVLCLRVNLWGGPQLRTPGVRQRWDGIVRRTRRCFFHRLLFVSFFVLFFFFQWTLFMADQSHATVHNFCSHTHLTTSTFKCLPPFSLSEDAAISGIRLDILFLPSPPAQNFCCFCKNHCIEANFLIPPSLSGFF